MAYTPSTFTTNATITGNTLIRDLDDQIAILMDDVGDYLTTETQSFANQIENTYGDITTLSTILYGTVAQNVSYAQQYGFLEPIATNIQKIIDIHYDLDSIDNVASIRNSITALSPYATEIANLGPYYNEISLLGNSITIGKVVSVSNSLTSIENVSTKLDDVSFVAQSTGLLYIGSSQALRDGIINIDLINPSKIELIGEIDNINNISAVATFMDNVNYVANNLNLIISALESDDAALGSLITEELI